jgi:hypothetical protein
MAGKQGGGAPRRAATRMIGTPRHVTARLPIRPLHPWQLPVVVNLAEGTQYPEPCAASNEAVRPSAAPQWPERSASRNHATTVGLAQVGGKMSSLRQVQQGRPYCLPPTPNGITPAPEETLEVGAPSIHPSIPLVAFPGSGRRALWHVSELPQGARACSKRLHWAALGCTGLHWAARWGHPWRQIMRSSVAELAHSALSTSSPAAARVLNRVYMCSSLRRCSEHCHIARLRIES